MAKPPRQNSNSLNFYNSRNIVDTSFSPAYVPGMNLDETAACLEALGNPTRLAVYRMLVRAGTQGRTVSEIRRELAIPGSTLSHHLKTLIGVRLVGQERRGAILICRANFERMQGIVDFLASECCRDEREAGPAAA